MFSYSYLTANNGNFDGDGNIFPIQTNAMNNHLLGF